MDKIIYKNTFKNVHEHSLNKAYWIKCIKKHIDKKLNNDCDLKEDYTDINSPICIYYNKKLRKSIRIIQYPPELYNSKFLLSQYLTAWESTIYIHEQKISELVIVTLLSSNNGKQIDKLIEFWLADNRELFEKELENIYNQQKNKLNNKTYEN